MPSNAQEDMLRLCPCNVCELAPTCRVSCTYHRAYVQGTSPRQWKQTLKEFKQLRRLLWPVQ